MDLLILALLVVIVLLGADDVRLRMAKQNDSTNLPREVQKNANADVVHPKPLPPELTDSGVDWDTDTVEDEE